MTGFLTIESLFPRNGVSEQCRCQWKVSERVKEFESLKSCGVKERKYLYMIQRDYEIAKELKERLSKVIQLIDFKGFGSRARGDADEYSDMDVFIEVENLDDQLKKIIRNIVWEVGFENSIYISPLIFTRYEIEDSPLRASPIVRGINEEGIRI